MAARINFLARVGGPEGLRALYIEQGMTQLQLCARFGTSKFTVNYTLKRLGMRKPHRPDIAIARRAILKTLAAGSATAAELAAETNIGRHEISRMLGTLKLQTCVEHYATLGKRPLRCQGYLWRLTRRGETVARMEGRLE